MPSLEDLPNELIIEITKACMLPRQFWRVSDDQTRDGFRFALTCRRVYACAIDDIYKHEASYHKECQKRPRPIICPPLPLLHWAVEFDSLPTLRRALQAGAIDVLHPSLTPRHLIQNVSESHKHDDGGVDWRLRALNPPRIPRWHMEDAAWKRQAIEMRISVLRRRIAQVKRQYTIPKKDFLGTEPLRFDLKEETALKTSPWPAGEAQTWAKPFDVPTRVQLEKAPGEKGPPLPPPPPLDRFPGESVDLWVRRTLAAANNLTPVAPELDLASLLVPVPAPLPPLPPQNANSQDRRNYFYWSAFHLAVWKGQEDMVDLFLSSSNAVQTLVNQPALGIGAFGLLIAQPNLASDLGHCPALDSRTPLGIAIRRGHTSIAQLLLNRGASIKVLQGCLPSQYQAATALHLAVFVGRTDMIRMLVSHGHDVDAEDTLHQTPLIWACAMDHWDSFRTLLSLGARVPRGLVWAACVTGRLERALNLMRLGIEHSDDLEYFNSDCPGLPRLDAIDKAGSALHVLLQVQQVTRYEGTYAVRSWDVWDAVHLLVQAGIELDGRDMYGFTPLMRAAQSQNVAAVRALIALEADMNAYNAKGSVLTLAFSQKTLDGPQVEIVEMLIKAGVDVNQEVEGRTALLALLDVDGTPHTQLRDGLWQDRLEMAKMLLKAGARPQLGRGSIIQLFVKENSEIARFCVPFIQYGAPFTVQTGRQMWQAFMFALESTQLEVMVDLHAAGYLFDLSDSNYAHVVVSLGRTPGTMWEPQRLEDLDERQQQQHKACHFLHDMGVDFYALYSGLPPLHVACLHGCAFHKDVRHMVEQGATDLNEISSGTYAGFAPLHLLVWQLFGFVNYRSSCRKQLMDLVSLLMRNGADINVRGTRRPSPLQLLIRYGVFARNKETANLAAEALPPETIRFRDVVRVLDLVPVPLPKPLVFLGPAPLPTLFKTVLRCNNINHCVTLTNRFLSLGADPNEFDSSGDTALMALLKRYLVSGDSLITPPYWIQSFLRLLAALLAAGAQVAYPNNPDSPETLLQLLYHSMKCPRDAGQHANQASALYRMVHVTRDRDLAPTLRIHPINMTSVPDSHPMWLPCANGHTNDCLALWGDFNPRACLSWTEEDLNIEVDEGLWGRSEKGPREVKDSLLIYPICGRDSVSVWTGESEWRFGGGQEV